MGEKKSNVKETEPASTMNVECVEVYAALCRDPASMPGTGFGIPKRLYVLLLIFARIDHVSS